jgi:hypothetical protein
MLYKYKVYVFDSNIYLYKIVLKYCSPSNYALNFYDIVKIYIL